MCVGGRPASVPLYRHIVERSGGRFLHHDGGEEESVGKLEATLAGTACTAILTDPQGVVVHATRSAASRNEVLIPLASRIGVNLAEDCVGTNGPGMTARKSSSTACSV